MKTFIVTDEVFSFFTLYLYAFIVQNYTILCYNIKLRWVVNYENCTWL